ncbi:MAG: c-type cytochrome [Roseibacillus sp.]|nr:c-type cytochrome [Roseibacillus sp.]HJM62793.1 PVC-type heme-binding CxxCH protein [Roseibacillus sp.]
MKATHLILSATLTTLVIASPAFAEIDRNALPEVGKGFEINFFVKEPHIINPSSLCFDKRGRLYVGAGPQYRHPKPDSPTDYIKILIDADGDGIAETVKTFAEGLNCVQSMAWKGDELWVANAPELTVLRDTDGDDVADEYRIIYTGLNNLRHSVHGLNWGPDGWLYFTMGNTWVKPNAPKPVRDLQGIKSDDKTEYPLTEIFTKDTYPKSYHPMNKDEKEGGVFRCRAGGHDLELYARGMRNPWDMCMDSGFNWLATDNDPGAPGERIFMPIRHGHYSMRHPWKFDWMGRHIAIAPSSDLFPSVSGSGTGVAFYSSEHFPEKYRDHHLIADWTNNCIFLYNPKWDGALQVPAEKMWKIVDGGATQGGDLGYKGAKGRALFRPTDIEIGPGGALYIAGWGSVYGTEYVPKDKWTPEENAKYQGRVFRLIHKESPLVPRAKWDTAKREKDIRTWSVEELLEDLGSNVHVWRVHAQDELVQRGEKIWQKLVMAIQTGGLTETQATWAIWAIGHIDKTADLGHGQMETFARGEGLTLKGTIDAALERYKLNIRIQATRILGENGAASAAPLLVKLLEDSEPRVRAAAMQSLDRIGWGDHSEAILDAVAYERDRVTYYTSWQVMRRQLPEEQRRKLLADERFGIRRMAALGLMEEGDRDLQRRANEFLDDTGAAPKGGLITLRISAEKRNFRDSTIVRFEARSPFQVHFTLDGLEPSHQSAKAGKQITVEEGATIKAAAFEGERRVSGVESLTVHKISDSEWENRLFVNAIGGEGTANSYRAELGGLQRGVLVYADRTYTFTEIPEALAGATYIRTHNDDKANRDQSFLRFKINLPATLYLAYDGRASPPKPLIDGMEKTDMVVRMSNGEKFPVYRRPLEAGEVVLGGNKVGGRGGESMYQVFLTKAGNLKTEVAAAVAMLPRANLKHGEEIFFGRGTCFACHHVHGKGVVLGPDLVGIHKRQDLNYIIKSILEPDAYIVEGFQQTSLKLKDGRELFGMIQEETALSMKIYLPTGERVVVQPTEIVKRSDAKHSGMPSSFSYTLNPQDVADLSAWIMSLK